ncbi:hypothetical protein E2562_020198 [Oryza meyeriana var. granulata]|uniref:Uncharacterized protein n=1 Tax=Oryza meyeriana var. granulata TaxID=110450 RepID=A0A6G1BMA9_9ORYZ|nr:hypothetical protein E2562_020198 [Oryza meyeriana var. granulata]
MALIPNVSARDRIRALPENSPVPSRELARALLCARALAWSQPKTSANKNTLRRVSGHSAMTAGDPRTTQLYVHSLTTQRGRMRKTRSAPTDELLFAWRK